MPWTESSTVSERTEFVRLASAGGAKLSELCRRFGIRRPTAYKGLGRYRTGGPSGLQDHSRAPHGSPAKTPAAVEAAVIRLRQQYPAWGGRKLRPAAGAQPHPPASRSHHTPPSCAATTCSALRPDSRGTANASNTKATSRSAPAAVIRSPSSTTTPGMPSACSLAKTSKQPRCPGISPLSPAASACPIASCATTARPRQPPGIALHRVGRLAVATWRRGQSRPAAPPANARQGQTLPPHADGRGPPGPTLRRPGGLPGPVRHSAGGVQHRAAARGPRPGRPRQSLPAEFTPLPRTAAASAIPRHRLGADGATGRLHLLPQSTLEGRQGVRPPAGRPPPTGRGRQGSASSAPSPLARSISTHRMPRCTVNHVPEHL